MQRVLSSPYQICLVVVVLYNIHELDKSVHLKAFSLKITNYLRIRAKLNRGKIGCYEYIHTSEYPCKKHVGNMYDEGA